MKDDRRYLWMMTTMDRYELPIIVADSLQELSEMSGYPKRTISAMICHYRKLGYRCKFKKVLID